MVILLNNSALDEFHLDLGGSSEVLLALILAVMMFSVALGLRAEHFRFFKENPKVYLGGVISQILGLPLLTVGLCYALSPAPSVALGMILIACCPGGNVSNLLAMFGRANTALSVSLTATSSLAAAFLTPISILFWCAFYPPTRNLLTDIDLDVAAFLSQTLIILALPLLLGMCTAHFAPRRAALIQKPLAVLSAIGLAAIIIFALIQYFPAFKILGLPLLGLVILHNGLAFALGALTGVVTGADTRSRRALTFEVGIQNSGLGIVILLTQLGGYGGAGAIVGLWGTWHIVGGLILVGVFHWSDRRHV